jgi:GH15 family glucan-1,4-alpha-glucosidase
VVGNGNVLVGFDANYSVRDLYFPRVGDANQTMGNVCRTGFFIDGRFAWLEDPAWERQLGYAEDSLVTAVTLQHPRLGITVKFEDFVDLARNWFIRNLHVSSRPASPPAASSITTTGTSRARTSATQSSTTRAIARSSLTRATDIS